MITIRGLLSHSPQERITAMSKNNVKKFAPQINLFLNPDLIKDGYVIETLLAELQIEANAMTTGTGVALMQLLLKAEVQLMVGDKYNRDEKLYPWGTQPGFLCVGGQKVAIERPRVRQGRGKKKEVIPTSYTKFQDPSERSKRVMREAMVHVSCRNYPGAIEEVRTGYGISKSVVSRDLVRETEAELDRLCTRSLSDFELAVLLIDGIELDGSMFIAAMGVDFSGKKQYLGFLDGATESSDVCKRMLEDLRERGLCMDHLFLAVLDGSKALSKAIRDIAGQQVIIQRCHVHKIRNVKSHLPEKFHAHFGRKIKAAYAMNDYQDARNALVAIIKELVRLNTSAARSLEEGLEETLTLHLLQLPDSLRKHFSSSNIIESSYAHSRDTMRNVKRWTTHSQKCRWVATALLQAEKGFRRIRGHRDMPIIRDAFLQYQSRRKELKQAA